MNEPRLSALLERAAAGPSGPLDPAELEARCGRIRRRRYAVRSGVVALVAIPLALAVAVATRGVDQIEFFDSAPPPLVEEITEGDTPIPDADVEAQDPDPVVVDPLPVATPEEPLATQTPAPAPLTEATPTPEATVEPQPHPSPTPQEGSETFVRHRPESREIDGERVEVHMTMARDRLLPGEDGQVHATNTGTVSVVYGYKYVLERWDGERWRETPDQGPWLLPAHSLGPGESTTFEFRTTGLTPGRYRYVKEFEYPDEDGYSNPDRAIWPTAEFTIQVT